MQHTEIVTCEADRLLGGGAADPFWRVRLTDDESCKNEPWQQWHTFTHRCKRAALAQLSDSWSTQAVQPGRQMQLRVKSHHMMQGAGSALRFKAAMWVLVAYDGFEVQGFQPNPSSEWFCSSALWSAMTEAMSAKGLGQIAATLQQTVTAWMQAFLRPATGDVWLIHWCCGWGSGVSAAAKAASFITGWVSVDCKKDRLAAAGGKQVLLEYTTIAPVGVERLFVHKPTSL